MKKRLTFAQKAGATKSIRRILREEALAVEFAALIRAGHTTETARAKMSIGLDKAKRVRDIAVRAGQIRPRQRKIGDPRHSGSGSPRAEGCATCPKCGADIRT